MTLVSGPRSFGGISKMMTAAIAAIWIAIFLAYSNSFAIPFQFDDTHTVQSNMAVRSLKYIPRYFVDAKTFSYRPENSGYRPLTTTALAVGYALSANDTWGYHLIKIVEQCLVATLILFLGLRLLPTAGAVARAPGLRFAAAWFAALVFGVHRANTETVNYITAIGTLQAGLFYLFAFLVYLRWRESSRLRHLALSLFLYLCSMWSKEEGITLPAMIVLYELIYVRKPGWLKTVAAYALVAALFIGLRVAIQPAVADTSRGTTPAFIYLITQFRSWLHYWKLFFWPAKLCADSVGGFEFSPGLGDWRVWASLATHAAIWVGAWFAGRRRRFVLFAVAWAYVTILPASSVFPLVEAVNEHRMYIPYMLLSLLAVWGALEGLLRLGAGRAALVAPAVATLALGVGAHARNEVWQSDISLWEDVYAQNPTSIRAMNVLGISLLNGPDAELRRHSYYNGQVSRAQQLLEQCHRVAPTYLPCIVHLSMAYARLRRYDDGLTILRRGHQFDPQYVHVNYHLGLYLKDYYGDFEAARRHFKRVYEASSGRFFQGTLKLAEMDIEDGHVQEGMKLVESVLQIDRSNADAWEVYAKGYLRAGDFKTAGQILKRLLEALPEGEVYLLHAANLAERTKSYAEARALFEKVAAAHPRSVQAWRGIERLAGRLGDAALARAAGEKAAEFIRSGQYDFHPSLLLVGEKPRQFKPE